MTTETLPLPPEIIPILGKETAEFSVKAGRAEPIGKSLYLIIFGAGWLAFTSMFLIAMFGPIFFGQDVHFSSGGKPMVAGPENLGPLLGPGLFVGLFVLIGIGVLASGLISLFKQGGYFVGTPTRLINLRKGSMREIDWEQFTGDIEVTGNSQNGNISLRMRTGKMVSRKNAPDEYVPDITYISGIANVYDIEQICQKRIKENDPTPATGTLSS